MRAMLFDPAGCLIVDAIVPDITAEHDDIGVGTAFNGLLNGFNVIPIVYGFDPLY
jgi:hypothetical protein